MASSFVSNNKTYNDNNNNNKRLNNFKTTNNDIVYQYSNTKMMVNISKINYLLGDLNKDIFFKYIDIETLYHYCNLILDKFDTKTSKLGLFKDDLNYGPKLKDIDIYFHPFIWEGNLHLAIGFTKYNKILFVHCSDFKNSKILPTFKIEASLEIQNFIKFFGHKLSKNSLKFPRIYSDLFEPTTNFNSINLLTVIFAFCLDSISLTRSFCDPQFSPRKFDISDFHPLIENLDIEFRIELKQSIEKEGILQLEKIKIEQFKREEEIKAKIKQQAEYDKKLLEKIRIKEALKDNNNYTIRKIDNDNNIAEFKRQKNEPKYIGKSSVPIEINDLEDNEEYNEENDFDQYLNYHKSTFINPNSMSKNEREKELKKLFLLKYSTNFQKYILNLTLFSNNNKIDLIFNLIARVSYNNITNLSLNLNNETMKPPYEVRESLHVTYKRRLKQEFDELKCNKLFEHDSLNQIIPLIFENGTIFLINIKTNDKFNCYVNLICISGRPNRSEREILKNYAFRKLIEMYVEKFNRLVIKIKISIVFVQNPTFYRTAMTSCYILHNSLWKNKFNLILKPKLENLDSYIFYFEKIMQSVANKDIFATELNFKRTIKYLLNE